MPNFEIKVKIKGTEVYGSYFDDEHLKQMTKEELLEFIVSDIQERIDIKQNFSYNIDLKHLKKQINQAYKRLK